MCGPDKNLEKEAARIIQNYQEYTWKQRDVQYVYLSVFHYIPFVISKPKIS